MAAHIELPEEFNIYAAAGLHGQMLTCLNGAPDGDITVQGAQVAELDASGVQLLVALAHECRARGLTLKLTEPSAALTGALASLGLQPFFNQADTAAEGAR